MLTRSEARKLGGSGRTMSVFVFHGITHAHKFDGGEFHMAGFLREGRTYSPPEKPITESIYANGKVSVWKLHVLPTNDTDESHAVSDVSLSVYRVEPGVEGMRFGVAVAIPAALIYNAADEFSKEGWWLQVALPPDQYDKFRELVIAGEVAEVRITGQVSGYSDYFEGGDHYVETNEHGVAECAITEIEWRRVSGVVKERSAQREVEAPPEVARLDAVLAQVSASLVLQRYILIALGVLVVAAVVRLLR